ncbi:sigma-54-dependent transcriptional regulator [Thiovibrio sp. JS02]
MSKDTAATFSAQKTALPPPGGATHVLIVDDDTDMTLMLKRVVERKCGCEVRLADSGEAALEHLRGWRPDVVLTDIKMPGLDGISLLRRAKELDPTISVILMTGYATLELAMEGLKEGAYDFFEKPFDNEHLAHAIQRAQERVCLLRENRKLAEELKGGGCQQGFVGQSPLLREAFTLIRKVADTDVTVLIRGESGTGKELAAKALHALSSRNKRQMVTINCPALPEHILESELFGYAKGAFTGASQDKKGLFLEADGSTILLDEIGDISGALQTKLLRVLQEKEIRPLGQTRSIRVDVRVLASTNQNLEEKIRQGLFREDLFYRLNVMTIHMPSLAEIPEDIPLLAQHFLKLYADAYGKNPFTLTPEAQQHLLKQPWPGNVRELQNTVKRAVLLADGPQITRDDLCRISPGNGDLKATGRQPAQFLHLPYNRAKQELVNSFSRDYLANALRKTKGNVTAAADASGIGRQAFQRLLRRFGLEAEIFRNGRADGD